LTTSADNAITVHYTLNAGTSTTGLTLVLVTLGNFAAPGGSLNCLVNGVAPATSCSISGGILTMDMNNVTLLANPTPNVIKFTFANPGSAGNHRLLVQSATTGPAV
jgi:hypothetical protein